MSLVDWPDLDIPRPRSEPVPYALLRWPAVSRTALATPTTGDSAPTETRELSITEALRTRRSVRELTPLDRGALGKWLHVAHRVQQTQDAVLGFALSRRSSPSAGAIHPIHLVIAEPGSEHWARYDAFTHELVHFRSRVPPLDVHKAMCNLVSAPQATLVCLVAEIGKTASKYENYASLVWREAGALLATMGLSAHGQGLGFCALGATGSPWVEQLLEEPGLVGVGAAFVGRIA